MKKLSLLSVLLVGCSSLRPMGSPDRYLASLQKDGPITFDMQLSQPLVFASGADTVNLKIQFKNEFAQEFKADPSQIKILLDGRASVGEITYKDGAFFTTIRPRLKGPTLRLVVLYKDQVSQILEIKTTIKPRSEKMAPIKSDSTVKNFVSGMEYIRQENFTPGQYEGFSISNQGPIYGSAPNPIASVEDSLRDFDFSYEEQANQNIALLVSDQPNGTVSHTMHSVFMFFPRIYLPTVEVKENEERIVTLTNGEQISFAKSGEITGGVFTEGKIDVGSSDPAYRLKRHYAELRYTGKGIILRANARGQMPQQGEFDKTPIDKLDYGIKYSGGVLIIDGSTGKTCVRPKSDFWSNADVSPILFKFPSDQLLDKYLRANCPFGIPDIKIDISNPVIDPTQALADVWSKCEKVSDVKSCLLEEMNHIEDKDLKAKVSFEVTLRRLKEKKEEDKLVDDVINKEIVQIRTTLLKDASWVSQGCLEKSRGLVQSSFKYSDIQVLIKDSLIQNCASVKDEMIKIAASELDGIKPKLEADLSWASLSPSPKIAADCLEQSQSYIGSSFRYADAPDIYLPRLKVICQTMESSDEFKGWLKTQSKVVEETVYTQVLAKIEARAQEEAQNCIDNEDYKFKFQRSNCFKKAWPPIEGEVIDAATINPLAQKVGVDFDSIRVRVAPESRLIYIKVVRKNFP